MSILSIDSRSESRKGSRPTGGFWLSVALHATFATGIVSALPMGSSETAEAPRVTPRISPPRAEKPVTESPKLIAAASLNPVAPMLVPAIRVLRVVQGLGYGLDEAAEQAAKRIRFKPAPADGRALDYRATVHITFRIS
jgi:hypothetical protein